MKRPTRMELAILHLPSQHPSVIHQVVLDPAKVRGDLIRLGDYPGDEATGWQRLQMIDLVDTIGDVEYDEASRTITVHPLTSDQSER